MNKFFVIFLFFTFYLPLYSQQFFKPVVFFSGTAQRNSQNQIEIIFENIQDSIHVELPGSNHILEYENSKFVLSRDIHGVFRFIAYQNDMQNGYFLLYIHPILHFWNEKKKILPYFNRNKNVYGKYNAEVKIYRKLEKHPLPPYIITKKQNEYSEVRGAVISISGLFSNSHILEHDLLEILNKKDTVWIPVFSQTYPHLNLEDSLAAMVYISTPSEYKFLNKVHRVGYLNFVWDGFDKDNKTKLKTLYFQRIYESNLYFTEFQEGWRTDRGLIYTIFGKPDAISLFADYEDWFYEHTQLQDSPVYFRFKIRKNRGIFVYELERKSEYYDRWRDAVDAWRNGLIIKSK